MATTKAAADKPKRAPQGPRAAYITYKVNDEGVVEFGEATRKPEDLLKIVSDNPGTEWHRFMIK